MGPYGGSWGVRTAEYTSDEVDSILTSRIKQAEKTKSKGQSSDNGNLVIKRNTRVKSRVNYTEDFPDVVLGKTQEQLDVEFRQKRLATAVVIVEKEHKFMVSSIYFKHYLTKCLVPRLLDRISRLPTTISTFAIATH